MPAHCVAYGCTQRRTIEPRKLGITFHRFPRDYDKRRKWEIALRREGWGAHPGENQQSLLMAYIVSVFLKIWLHHIARFASPEGGSTRKQSCKTVLLQGF